MVETRSQSAKRKREEEAPGPARKRRTPARKPEETPGAPKKQCTIAPSPTPEEENCVQAAESRIEVAEPEHVDLVTLYDALGKTQRYTEALSMIEGLNRKQLLAAVPGKEKEKAPNVLSRVFQADAVYNKNAGIVLAEIVRKVLPLVTPADLLVPRNLVKESMWSVQAKEDLFLEIIDKCVGVAVFTGEVRKELLIVAMLRGQLKATATLVDGIDSSLVCRLDFLKLPIIHDKQEALEVLLDNLPGESIVSISSSLLATAIWQLKFNMAHMLIDRFPMALSIPVSCRDMYMGAIHACERDWHSFASVPPVTLWRKMVDGTPKGLLLLRLDDSKETILHMAVRFYFPKHVEILLERFTPAALSLKNAKGLTATDIARRRKAGKYRCQLQARFNADGKTILQLLTAGAATKSAGNT